MDDEPTDLADGVCWSCWNDYYECVCGEETEPEPEEPKEEP